MRPVQPVGIASQPSISTKKSHHRRVEGDIIRDLLRYFPSNLLPGFGYLVGIFVFTRSFARADYGWYVLAAAVATPVIGLLTQWILRPAMRFYAEYQAQDKGKAYTQSLSTAVGLTSGAVVLVSAIAVLPLLATGWLSSHMVLATGEFAFVLGSVPNTIALGVMRSSLRARMFFVLQVVAEILAIGFPLLMVFTVSHDVGWLAWGQALAVLLVLPYALHTTGMKPRSIRFRLAPEHREILRRFLIYGMPMVIWFVGANLLTVEGRYVLQAFKGSGDVGIYGVNFDLMTAISGILNGTIVLGFGPALFHHWAQGRKTQVIRAISDTTDLYLLLGLGFVGGVLVIGPTVESVLIGPHFRVGADFLVPAALAMIFFGLGLIGHKCLELGEGTTAMASSAIWAGIVNLVLNLALVPFFGFMATVYVTCVCYALYAAFIWFQTRSLSSGQSQGGTWLGHLLGHTGPAELIGRKTIAIGHDESQPEMVRSVPWMVRWQGIAKALIAVTVASYCGLTILTSVPSGVTPRLVFGAGVYVVAWLLAAMALGGLRLPKRAAASDVPD